MDTYIFNTGTRFERSCSFVLFRGSLLSDRKQTIHEKTRNHTNKFEIGVAELLLKDEVYQIIGAAMDVYYQLGRGFQEPVYQEALEIELGRRRIPFKPQCEINIFYKGQRLTKHYVPDFVCYDQVITEIKVCDRLLGIEESQILNYLKITQMHVGLLINFGSLGNLEWKRYVL